ncbi:hypothetical protein TGRUB_200600 [Toxoplasma gondii RUB]|uniref:Uncharacterized protein n=3 Tax=Toxoplasma gondii TaxID=5811 RepID=S7UFG6_TOXGG|nr:hypothetical protein TGGT1_200600 [Toxoplasma gondii GT1]KFG56696.1 hypothetical protein TGRUB_200600 [Toxoplasma gondii RUB]
MATHSMSCRVPPWIHGLLYLFVEAGNNSGMLGVSIDTGSICCEARRHALVQSDNVIVEQDAHGSRTTFKNDNAAASQTGFCWGASAKRHVCRLTFSTLTSPRDDAEVDCRVHPAVRYCASTLTPFLLTTLWRCQALMLC